MQAGGDEECSVCLSDMQDPVVTICAHVFCRRCIEAVINKVSQQCCNWTGCLVVCDHMQQCTPAGVICFAKCVSHILAITSVG